MLVQAVRVLAGVLWPGLDAAEVPLWWLSRSRGERKDTGQMCAASEGHRVLRLAWSPGAYQGRGELAKRCGHPSAQGLGLLLGRRQHPAHFTGGLACLRNPPRPRDERWRSYP